MYALSIFIVILLCLFIWYYLSYNQVIGIEPESDDYMDVYYIFIYPKQNLNDHTSWCEDILLNGPNKIGLLIPSQSSIRDIETYRTQFKEAFRHSPKVFKFQDKPTPEQKEWCRKNDIKISHKKLLNHTKSIR